VGELILFQFFLTFNRAITMKLQSIFGAVTALGILSSSIAATTLMGTTAAFADDWPNSNDRPAWSQRCDRNWDNAYCNPKVNPNNNQRWSEQDFNRNQDTWNQDGDQGYSRDPDQWRNSNQGQWQSRDREYWRNHRRTFTVRLSEGTSIPAYSERSGRRIVLRGQERYPLTLIVSQDVGRTSRGGVVALPRNSRIEGELVPSPNGYRFEANQVRLPNGQQSRLWATSSVVRQNNDDAYDRDYRRDSTSSTRGESLLSAIFGRSNSSDSAVRGDIYSRYPDERYPNERYPNDRRDLVVINPDQSFDLRLTRDFVMDWRNF
jgi:hypothetical protein